MKQTLLIETSGAGKEHLIESLNLGELNFLKLSDALEMGENYYAFYFNRLSFEKEGIVKLKQLETELKLLGSCFKFEFYNY